MKFRKKPVVIDAVQWFPPGDPRHVPEMLSHRKGNAVDPPDYRQDGDLWQFSTIPGMGDDIFMIRTPDGSLRVSPGDWIITGVKGEKYPCKPDIFAATYESEEAISGPDALRAACRMVWSHLVTSGPAPWDRSMEDPTTVTPEG